MCTIKCSQDSCGCKPEVNETHIKTPHKHAAVIKAWADGAKIEWSYKGQNYWRDCGGLQPCWSSENDYRVKPEPKPDCRVTLRVVKGEGSTAFLGNPDFDHNIAIVFDGESGELKSVEKI